ncbi:MAG TPA: hypothetical protein VGO91_15345 [Pyrinomonadaceae bacterium]|nr:hypothetical protein [Pyrinomonadaceae bacterium]
MKIVMRYGVAKACVPPGKRVGQPTSKLPPQFETPVQTRKCILTGER